MQITPHLTFDGQCEEAFLEYQRILGGTITTLMKYGESPMASGIDSRWHQRIVHATLVLGEFELAGVDLPTPDYKKPQGFSVMLTIPDLHKSEFVFKELAKQGEIQMELQAVFWSPGFGVLVDRFGVSWEINCAAVAQK